VRFGGKWDYTPALGLAHPLRHRKRSQDASKIEARIWGELGGGADSMKFCCQAGMGYVSASPLRAPIARLAAEQVVMEGKPKAKRKNK
jgi:pyruvate,orthophosphate dikinase